MPLGLITPDIQLIRDLVLLAGWLGLLAWTCVIDRRVSRVASIVETDEADDELGYVENWWESSEYQGSFKP